MRPKPDLATIPVVDVRLGGPVRQLAIARRPMLSRTVTDAIAEHGSERAVTAACANDNAARSIWAVPATSTTAYSCTDGRRLSAHETDATHAAWGPNNMIVWGSVTGGTNSTSPVLSDLVLWQDDMVRTLESGTGDIRNPSWSPVGTVIGDW